MSEISGAQARKRQFWRPRSGRGRINVVVKHRNHVVWRMAGPSNIVEGLFTKWFQNSSLPVSCHHCGLKIPALEWTEHETWHHRDVQRPLM